MHRVLIADDKEENRYYLEALLSGHGYTVDCARHGAEALAIARETPPDVIISDLLMPVMDGYTLLWQWKADARLRDVPFIVYTATYTEPEDEKLALELGADAFILKPAEPDEFIARLRDIQSRPAAAAAERGGQATKDEEIHKDYNQVLVRKLEEKTIQLEEANRALQRDIAQRQATEAALRASEERFRQIAENIAEVFWLTDPGKQQMIYVSPAYETIWGRPIAGVYDDPGSWLATIHAEDRQRVTAAVASQAAGGYQETYRIVRPDGSIRWIRDRAFPVHDADRTVYRIAGVADDITERQALEDQLRQSQRLESVGSLTGGVAHDFNNLLTVILGNAELLSEVLDQTSEEGALADMIVRAAQRGANLTQRLLAFARRQALDPQAVDVNELIGTLDGLLRRTLGEHVDIVLDCGADVWPAMIDPGQLETALLNLAINARDAMSASGRLTITTGKHVAAGDASDAGDGAVLAAGDYVRLTIRDTGTGIAPEDLERVFEPFFTTKATGKGTGLGLAMVYGFIKQSGGDVRLFSRLDQGTCVDLYLPRAAVEHVPAIVAEPSPVIGGSAIILLVEDDELVLRYARGQLTALGYEVLEAPDGPAAMAIIRLREDIDLLFSDVVMSGGMSGPELAEAASELRPALKVLYTSGYSEDAIVHRGRLRPGVRLLQKPYRRADLAAAIREALI
ncbi:MAG: response regulator [Gammaproteobacteria bacterium]